MTWTKETPKKPGWYWYRRQRGGGPCVLNIAPMGEPGNLYIMGDSCAWPLADWPGDVQWSGPIPEPEEGTP